MRESLSREIVWLLCAAWSPVYVANFGKAKLHSAHSTRIPRIRFQVARTEAPQTAGS
jgi:hypothetical protein